MNVYISRLLIILAHEYLHYVRIIKYLNISDAFDKRDAMQNGSVRVGRTEVNNTT